LADPADGAIREGEPPILQRSDHAVGSLPNYWLVFLGPVVGAMSGLLIGYFVYGAMRGGGGYYGEITVFFEYLLIGLLTGLLIGLAVGFWLGLKVCRRTKRRT
jgi:ABC-type antimicrobial peptide transport system permease subunit